MAVVKRGVHCPSGKTAYRTGALARKELDRIRRRMPRRGERIPQRSYPCDECGHYHLTSDGSGAW